MKPEESFVGQPIRSLQTMLRTIAQMEPGLITPEADGVYSPNTARAVASFQRSRGLRPTGVTDQKTHEAIVRAYQPARVEAEKAQPIQITLNPGQIIGQGEEHHLLYLVQTMLFTLGLLVDGVGSPAHSGVLDPQTRDSLAAFQLYAGLPPTGNLDKQTWKALALQYALASDELSRRLDAEESKL